MKTGALGAWSLVAVLASACAAGGTRPDPARDRAVLVVRASVRDAVLWIDGQPIGELATLPGGVRVPAGPRRIELRHDRYHTRYAEVTLRPGERRVLQLTLAEHLP